ncbi:aryl-sulfate sulfotransferase [Rubrivirga sp. IMCC45206]|uniref:aryl-sulfate sulfotransferase n=1 Tax=Rubrivirga sp. IMCC45206 TaxID=3391614 RepID=UPI00398FB44C
MRRPVPLLFALALVWGCDATGPEPPPPAGLVTSLTVAHNPTGATPLAALASLQTTHPVTVEVTVEGRGGPATEIRHRTTEAATSHAIPLLGLYPGSETAVRLDLRSADGRVLETRQLSVAAPPLAADFPAITVDVPPGAGVRPGVTVVSYFGHDGSVTPQRVFAYDAAGAIRYVLDVSGHPDLGALFFDNGVSRLANGNWLLPDRSSNAMYEIDLVGRVVRSWPFQGVRFHHEALELPSGNLLATVDREGAPTVEDVLVELDRGSGAVVAEWDLTRSLDPSRRAWPTDLADLDVDWFHANGVAYDAGDDAIVVSGRTQGVVKLTRANRVQWVLAPHRGWGRAGDGTDLATRLLQPLDASGAPITDPAVLDGAAPHPDFEWAWYQHAPEVLPGGRLLLFDNGDNRGYGAGGTYSRAVLYAIDEPAMTVRQLWAYGRERGAETYSRIVSDVDLHEPEGVVLFAPGAVAGPAGKVVEVSLASGAVLAEVTIRPPQAPFGITFHRVERMPLYPAR